MLTRNQKMLKEAANHTIMPKNLITIMEQVVEIIAMRSIRTRITMENVIIVARLTAKIMVPAAKTMKTVLTKTKIKTKIKTAIKTATKIKTAAVIAPIIKFRTVKINSKGLMIQDEKVKNKDKINS